METMDPWLGIAEFLAVVDEGSFTAAARRLHVSKAHVSRRLQGLEEQLGVRLVQRTTRSMRLTPAGRQYYERCAALSAGLEEANREISGHRSEARGPIHIALGGTYVEAELSPVFARFAVRHPRVELRLSFGFRMVDLVAEGFDLAVRYGALEDSSLIAKKLAEHRLKVCASPGYLERCGRPARPRDLEAHNCLGNQLVWRFKHSNGVRSRKLAGTLRCNRQGPLLAAVRAGLGIVQLPAYATRPWIESGELIELLEAYAPPPVATWLLYPDRQLPRRVELLIDAVAGHFGRAPASVA